MSTLSRLTEPFLRPGGPDPWHARARPWLRPRRSPPARWHAWSAPRGPSSASTPARPSWKPPVPSPATRAWPNIAFHQADLADPGLPPLSFDRDRRPPRADVRVKPAPRAIEPGHPAARRRRAGGAGTRRHHDPGPPGPLAPARPGARLDLADRRARRSQPLTGLHPAGAADPGRLRGGIGRTSRHRPPASKTACTTPFHAIVAAIVPRIVAAGIASEEDIDLPTLEARLDAERQASESLYVSDIAFCIVARRGAPDIIEDFRERI